MQKSLSRTFFFQIFYSEEEDGEKDPDYESDYTTTTKRPRRIGPGSGRTPRPRPNVGPGARRKVGPGAQKPRPSGGGRRDKLRGTAAPGLMCGDIFATNEDEITEDEGDQGGRGGRGGRGGGRQPPTTQKPRTTTCVPRSKWILILFG